VLGGTFNPPHNGHLACARHALRELRLDALLLVPVNIPPHKRLDDDPGPDHRVAMCRLLAQDDPRLEVSLLEVGRPGPSYTVDTLRSIHGGEASADLTLVMGADMARTLATWHEPCELLDLARVAVAEREGAAQREIAAALSELPIAGRLEFLDMPEIDVSSSTVRERLAAGRAIDDLVPAAVAHYIARHGLYSVPTDRPEAVMQ
jgi:nicotinate-nucleotide adenylyltransferase